MTDEIILTTEQTEAISAVLRDLDSELSKIDHIKDNIKESIKALADETEVPKKILNKMLKVYHKRSIQELKEEDNLFYDLFDKVVNNHE